MRIIRIAIPLMLAALLTAVTTGCNTDVFDKDKFEQIVRENFPVDTVDMAHDWNLLTPYTVNITADAAIDGAIAKVQVLTDNPYSSPTAEIAAESSATKGQRIELRYELPTVQTQAYAAVVSTTGTYYVVPFTAGQAEVNFSSGMVTSSGTFTAPTYQTFTYLYEENYPEPGDFDYNDLVMRISKRVAAADSLCVTVTVVAVGATKQIAAAIRLPGISYQQVEAVTIQGGTGFADDYPQIRMAIKDTAPWLESRQGEAVLNLFEDAHWVLRHRLDKLGSIQRLFFNTEHDDREEYSATVASRSRTFNIKFKEGTNISQMLLSDLDPFIIESFNGTNFEVHMHNYKFDEAIWGYYSGYASDYDNHLSWALLVPDAHFRYAIEGVPVSTFRDGEIFGAYNQLGHSFGEWGRNHLTCQDWWQYPQKNLIY